MNKVWSVALDFGRHEPVPQRDRLDRRRGGARYGARYAARAAWLVVLVGAAVLLMLSAAPSAGASQRTAQTSGTTSSIVELSKSCPASSAEVEQATDPKLGYVYEAWIGCGKSAIAFARSTDGGKQFSAPVLLPDSVGRFVWDPALAVAPDGTLYVSFMIHGGGFPPHGHSYPVVEVSRDHGSAFTTVTSLVPPQQGNWGDRDFIAAGSHGRVYLSWDYGPSAAEVKVDCPKGASCSFAGGDFNIVVQSSSNFGQHFGPMVRVSPGYPLGGGVAAPLLVEPTGGVDMVYLGYATNRTTRNLGPGHLFFTSSGDGGAIWTKPVRIGPLSPYIRAVGTWWIDASLGLDRTGNLYATWDTQAAEDIGWLSYSSDHGLKWSPPLRVTPDHDSAAHIVEVVGAGPGEADVGWLSDSSPAGYALYLRAFSIRKGWLGSVITASSDVHGSRSVWPGDTFGISYIPGAAVPSSEQRVAVSWGSAVVRSAPSRDDIFAGSADLPS